MEVRRIENPEGSLIRIELTRTSEEDFKEAIMAWIQNNYPDWDYQEFFQRLSSFQAGTCIIDITQE